MAARPLRRDVATGLMSGPARESEQSSSAELEVGGAPPDATLGETLRVTTWNLGYAALGVDSEFVADGGRKLRPSSKAQIARNAAAMAARLSDDPSDLLLLQEAARPGFMTRGVDLLDALDARIAPAQRWFYADVRSAWPPPRGLTHGLVAYARTQVASAELLPLPLEKRPLVAWLWRRYGAILLRLRGEDGFWTVINLHFSAFDPRAQTRLAQLDAALRVAEAADARGDAVVLGGDFNLGLARPTAAEAPPLCWLHAFPEARLRRGWRLACDPSIPTVRTLSRPYCAQESAVAVIDGFIVSPRVEVLDCAGAALGFEHSDHQPVRALFRRRKRG